LDEMRLLGKDGFPQLLKDTKNFKPKGKGHEVITILILILHSFSRTDATALRQWTWIAYSKCINSGPTDYILKLDLKRR
jgi:hypothetical protein